MITPLPYQTPIVAAIQRSLRAGKPHLETSDTGMGKTFMALLAARELSQHIRVICPISVQTAWLEAAEATGASLEFVANIEALKPSRFLVAHTTTRRGRDGQDKKTATYTWAQPIPDDAVLILDECFPGYVEVDGRRIDSIRVGDTVKTHRGYGRVAHVFRKRASKIARVVFQSGRTLICTPNHPIATERGWICAGSLTCGDSVHTIDPHETRLQKTDIRTDLPYLSEGFYTGISKAPENVLRLLPRTSGKLKPEKAAQDIHQARGSSHTGDRLPWVLKAVLAPVSQKEILLPGVCNGEIYRGVDGLQPKALPRTDEKEQPHVGSACSSKAESRAESDGMETAYSGWQREAPSVAPTGARCGVEVALRGSGSNRSDSESDGVSQLLQDRHCQRGTESGSRSRREQPQQPNAEGARPEEDRLSGVERVDRVEVYEQGRDAEFERLCPEGRVYNLEVENGSTYFADGILVHNCHRFSSDSSQAAAIAWSWAPRPAILLSATPFDTILKTKAVHVLFRLTTPSAWWVYVQRKYRASRGFFGGLQISRQRDTEALASLREALGPHMTGLRKADLAQYFQPVIIHTRTLPVDNPEQLESLYVQDLERLRDETDVAAVEFLRSRQIAEAMMAPLVSEMMDDYAAQGNTVLAFVNFKATLKVLPAQAVFHGELSKDEKDAFVSGVQANRITKGALTLDAGGESITLDDQITGSNPRVLFIIAGVTARAIIQAIGRGNRAKSKSPLTVFILFPDCPSGRRIRRIVDAKKTNLQTILDSELL